MEKAEERWLECAHGQRQTPAWLGTMLVSVLVEGSLHCDGACQSGLCVSVLLVLRSQERVDMPPFTAPSWWTPSLPRWGRFLGLKRPIISAWKFCFDQIVSVHPCIAHCLCFSGVEQGLLSIPGNLLSCNSCRHDWGCFWKLVVSFS